MPVANDTFDRANETPLAGNWTTITSETAWNLSGNIAVPSSLAADCGVRYSGAAFQGDQSSSAKLSVNGTGGGGAGVGLAVRVASGARTYYRFVLDHAATNNAELRRFVAGASAAIDTWTTGVWSDGQRFEFRVVGPTANAILGVYLDGALIRTFTDTAGTVPASGSPGLSYSSTTSSASADDWVGSDAFGLVRATFNPIPFMR